MLWIFNGPGHGDQAADEYGADKFGAHHLSAGRIASKYASVALHFIDTNHGEGRPSEHVDTDVGTNLVDPDSGRLLYTSVRLGPCDCFWDIQNATQIASRMPTSCGRGGSKISWFNCAHYAKGVEQQSVNLNAKSESRL